MLDLKCPKCGSEDVFQKKDGSCLCGECGHRFVPQQEPTEFVPMRLFISYGHKESEICRRICQALKDRGHDPWFDESELRFGCDWRERIAKGIEDSKSVVACLSAHSTRERGVCLDELAIAVGVKGGNVHSILLDEEDRVQPPATIGHEQWLDMRDWKEKLAAGEDVFKPWFDAKMRELFDVLESPENKEFCGQISEIKKRLTVYYSTSRQEKLLRDLFVGRAWLDTEVAAWLENDTAPRTCLLTGAPGVGKSAYAAHFTHYNGSVAASVFCSSEMDTFNDPRTVIQTLAYLMACRLPAYRRSLMLHLPENRAAVERLSEKELFEQLISKPLRLSIDGGHQRMVVLIDGLDEAGDPRKNPLAQTLAEYADALPDWLRILIVARDVAAVSAYTKGAYRIEIGNESADNLNDIRAYYRAELEPLFGKDPQWADALERMTARSQGIFLYAQMLVSLLKSRGTLDADGEYPDGLDAIFGRWFRWFFPDEGEFRTVWRPAICCMLGAPAPLPAETLRRVMHWGEVELADFRARLKVLLRAEKNAFGDEVLVFDHAFVREWLTRGAGENLYFCSARDGEEKLAGELYAIFERDPKELTFWEAVHLLDLPLGKGQREKAVENLTLDDRVSDAGIYCDTWGNYDRAEEIFDKALLVAEERDRKLANEDSRRIVAFYLKAKSEIAYTRGKMAQSMELEETAFAIIRDITEKNPTDRNRKRLSIGYTRIGDRLEAQGKFDDAMEMYQKGLAIREELCAKLGAAEWQRALSVSYNNVGDILEIRGDFSGALEMYRKSLAIREKLNHELGTPQLQRDLAISYERVGDILKVQGDFIGVLKMYRKSLAIREKLSRELGTPQSRRDLAIGYGRVGDILKVQGDFIGALEMYRKGLAIREKLSRELGTPQSRRDLSISYGRVGDILKAQDDFIGALEMYRKSLAIDEKLSHELGTPQSRRDLSVSYGQVGDILKEQDDFEGALKMYRKSFAMDEKLSHELGTPQSRRDLSVSYGRVGDILKAQDDFEGALKMYRKSLAIDEKLSRELGTPQSRRDLSVSYGRVGDILKEQGGFEDALEMYRKSLVIREKLSHELGTPESWRDLSVAYNDMARLLEAQNDVPGALEMYRKDLAIAEKLAAELSTPESMRDLSVSYFKTGKLLENQGDMAGALEMYRKDLAIAEKLDAELDTLQSQRDLSLSYENVGRILEAQKDFPGALEMYQKSLVMDDKLCAACDTPKNRRNRMIGRTHIVFNLFSMGRYGEALPFAQEALAIGEALAAQLDTDDARSEAEVMRRNLQNVEAFCKKS